MSTEMEIYTARLVSCTRSHIEGITTMQDMIAYTARVSNPANQMNTETSDRLIRYLMRNKHWSPFEMVSACLELYVTRDIGRQILRHRSFSFQEFSQRYADPRDMGTVFREARTQDDKNRQNSYEVEDPDLQKEWDLVQGKVEAAVQEAYNWALNKNLAKEQRRVIFPEGMTPSRIYMSGSVRSWLHYLQLRTGNGTQKEHRQVARSCLEALRPQIPDLVQFVDGTL